MKIHQVEQRSQEWHNLRRGKITGTGLKRLTGSKTVRDNFFYEILAQRLSVDDGNDESDMDRGVRLEAEAIEAFEKKTGIIVDLIGYLERDDNEFIGCSPDGMIETKKGYTEAVEVKCLSSANHIKAWLENEIPKDYYPQVIQAFIVNDDLEKLHFVLYDPRVTVHPLHIIEVNRKDIEADIAEYSLKEMEFIKEVNKKIDELISV